jgi:hypothetical protein
MLGAVRLDTAQATMLLAFSALPTASSCYVLACAHGLQRRLCGGLVTLSTLLGWPACRSRWACCARTRHNGFAITVCRRALRLDTLADTINTAARGAQFAPFMPAIVIACQRSAQRMLAQARWGARMARQRWRSALPRATARRRLRSQRAWPMRRIGAALGAVQELGLAPVRNSVTSCWRRHALARIESRQRAALAYLFQGHTSWQSSQP